MIAEYLDHAIRFEQLARLEENPKFKAELLRQAEAYRKLASERAANLNIPLPKLPSQSN